MPCLDAEVLGCILDTLDRFAEQELPEKLLLGLDESEEFPVEILKALYDPAKVGLHLVFLPEEAGGIGGGAQDIYRVAEKLAGFDLGISTAVLATFLGTDPIRVGGTPEQKAFWMGRIAEEGLLVAYGATEPQAGSDLGAMKTRAEPVHEDGQITGYRINGQKQWISNGGFAQLYTVLAVAPGGPSWFLVERDTPGFTYGKPEEKHGIRASNTAALFLDDVFVPVDRLVGGVEGRGLAQAQAVFGFTRLMVAAFGLGAGWAALKRAVIYAQTRFQGGSVLSEKQGYTHKLLVGNAVRLEASRAYIEWTAERLDSGEPGLATEGAVAKYSASEAGNKAAEDAIQALGGYGYTRDYLVEKIKRDVRITTIYEGTSEILEWTIARDRWQIHLKTQGAHYPEWARRMDEMHASNPDCGFASAAVALRSLSAVLEACRIGRLTRNQHVLFRLGELVALAETAAVFAQRSLEHPSSASPMGPDCWKTLARVHAREAAWRVTSEGTRLVLGASTDPVDVPVGVDLVAARRVQAGLLADMDEVARRLVAAFPAES